MKLIISALVLLTSTMALAISNSTPVGNGAGVTDFDVTLYRSFNMPDGNAVNAASAITQISYRDVWLGSSAMLLTINGKKYTFKLKQNVSIDKGYPVVYGSATSAGNSGQGIAVGVNQDYSAYAPIKSTNYETRTCTGDRIEVCRDFSHNGYGYECLSTRLTGSETVLVEYSEQKLPATVTLSASGSRLAHIDYLTKDFNKRVLQTVNYCDANSFSNEREARRRLRQRLKSRFGKPKGSNGIKTH